MVHREDRGGIMTEERRDIMMMMAVPTHIFHEERNHLSGYCLPSLIRKFNKLTFNV